MMYGIEYITYDKYGNVIDVTPSNQLWASKESLRRFYNNIHSLNWITAERAIQANGIEIHIITYKIMK